MYVWLADTSLGSPKKTENDVPSLLICVVGIYSPAVEHLSSFMPFPHLWNSWHQFSLPFKNSLYSYYILRLRLRALLRFLCQITYVYPAQVSPVDN